MKRVFRLSGLAIVILLCFAPSSLAQNTNMYFNGGFQGSVWCGGPDGCAGTGFYDGSINNVNVGPGQKGGPGFVCDDYFDNVTAGESWNANGINVATLNSSNIGQTLFGSKLSTSAALSLYSEMAYLMNQMFTTNPDAAHQAAYSEALWYLSSQAVQPGKIKWSSLDSLAQQYVTDATTNHSNDSLSQYANLWVYTPSPFGPGEAQEMWSNVAVPDGGSAAMYLLLGALSCCGAMLIRFRGRQVRYLAS